MSQSFSNLLIDWYNRNQRNLPWRETSDPYKIWLSEIILQQTRVNQGLPYYNRFISRFPSVFDLAKASEDEVMRLWQGLGYYSRARNLHECAKSVVNDFNGLFPQSYHELLKLKGIGKYTGAAIASFAFDQTVPVVDGNVFRVLSRYFEIIDDIAQPKTFAIFFNVANQLIPEDNPAAFNQALMELGATVCKPKNPSCNICPIAQECSARIKGKQSSLPVKKKKIKVKTRFLYYLVWKQNEKLAMKKRGPKDIWQGLFDFDVIETKNALSNTDILKRVNDKYPDVEITDISEPIRHILTHQRLEAVFIEFLPSENAALSEPDLQYFTRQEVEQLPKPRLIEKYLTSKNI